jgi:hypothetical protein
MRAAYVHYVTPPSCLYFRAFSVLFLVSCVPVFPLSSSQTRPRHGRCLNAALCSKCSLPSRRAGSLRRHFVPDRLTAVCPSIWDNGQSSSFVACLTTLLVFRTVGVVSWEGSRRWRSCGNARYCLRVLLVLRRPTKHKQWVGRNSNKKHLPHARSKQDLRPTQPPGQWVLGLYSRGKEAGAWRYHPSPPPSSAVVEERVWVYPCSPCGPLWPVLGWTLPFFRHIQVFVWYQYSNRPSTHFLSLRPRCTV